MDANGRKILKGIFDKLFRMLASPTGFEPVLSP
jgi:hypothetical protein